MKSTLGTVLVTVLLLATAAGAEVLQVEANAPAAAADRPTRGSTMSSVEARYGAPTTRHAAVGDPPISRWDYPQFVVFFEHDRVLHAVLVRPAG